MVYAITSLKKLEKTLFFMYNYTVFGGRQYTFLF